MGGLLVTQGPRPLPLPQTAGSAAIIDLPPNGTFATVSIGYGLAVQLDP
jgi:hypothetical protein